MPLSEGQKKHYESMPLKCAEGKHLWEPTVTGRSEDTEVCARCTKTKVINTCKGGGKHRWRFSDSSFYDFKCRDCGETD